MDSNIFHLSNNILYIPIERTKLDTTRSWWDINNPLQVHMVKWDQSVTEIDPGQRLPYSWTKTATKSTWLVGQVQLEGAFTSQTLSRSDQYWAIPTQIRPIYTNQPFCDLSEHLPVPYVTNLLGALKCIAGRSIYFSFEVVRLEGVKNSK